MFDFVATQFIIKKISLRDLRCAHIPPRLRRGDAKHEKKNGS